MPELPEVETTRRGVEPHVRGRRLDALEVRESRLRWPVDPDLPARLRGATLRAVDRRAKYLVFDFDCGARRRDVASSLSTPATASSSCSASSR